MTALALDVRTRFLARSSLRLALLADTLDRADIGIHGARNIGPLAVAFVVGETRFVERLDSLFDIFEIITVARLVAIAPHENRGVVAVAAHMVLRTLDHSISELHLVG